MNPIPKFLSFVQSKLFSLPAIGLDISDESYHYVKAEKSFSGGFDILYYGKSSIPPGIIEFGEIKKEQELAKLLSELFRREKRIRHDNFLVASLPEEKVFIKLIQIPNVSDPHEQENAILFEAEGSIPLSFQEMYFDYHDITSPNAALDHRDIIVIAFPRAVIDSYARVFKQAGFSLFIFELESLAIMRALVNVEVEKGPYLIIDIGRTKSGFSFFSNGSIFFTSTIPIGGKDFERAIQEALSVDAIEAEKIKKEKGFSKNAHSGKLISALDPFVSMITAETTKNKDFFETHDIHAHDTEVHSVQKILLCGGDSYLSGLPEEISKQAGVPVEYANPLRFFSPDSIKKSLFEEKTSRGYTTALGLALRAIQQN